MMLTTGKKEPLEDPTGPGRKTSIKIDVEIRRTDYPSLLKPLTDNLVGMSHVDKGQLCMKMQGVARRISYAGGIGKPIMGQPP